VASLSLNSLEDSNSFYVIDIYWSISMVYSLSLGAEQIFLNKSPQGEWDAICRSGQEYFRLSKPLDPAVDERSSLLSLFEEDAIWHYTNSNESQGHRSIIISQEVVDMWVWQNPDNADDIMVSLIYNKNVKDLAYSILRNRSWAGA